MVESLVQLDPDGVPVDLAAPATDPWRSLAVPPGWRDVARIARAVAADLDALAETIVDGIRAEIPAYRDGQAPLDDVHGSVVSNLRMILIGVAEHRGPTTEEVAVRRELGVRRALQGLPIDAVIQAFHIGYRELWRAMVRALPDDDPQATTQLLTAATTVWGWVHHITDALVAAHGATMRRLEARIIGARQRFVELLAGGDVDGSEAARLARSLGFDPLERFEVVVVSGVADDHDAVELQRRIDGCDGRHAVVARGATVVVVAQDGDHHVLDTLAREVVTDATVAHGARRAGLGGARESLADAQLTLEVLEAGTSGAFEDAWLWATLHGAQRRLRGVLEVGSDVAASHPHLRDAVEAYAAHGFSVSEAARQLDIHANTVGYRLDRWSDLTGWQVRTFAGLARSLAAIRLA